MAKAFFEVFPTLDVESDIRQLLGNVQIEKVSTNRAKDVYRIYLYSTRLIPKNIFSGWSATFISRFFKEGI